MTSESTTVVVRRPRRSAWLNALGRGGLPSELSVAGRAYRLAKVLKHDFFAATGLYESADGRAILKLGRRGRLFGVPMTWLGRLLTRHELRLYRYFDDLPGIPRVLCEYGDNGFVHVYVEGHELRKGERLADDFFPQLAALLDQVHARDAAYVDLEKCENIIVGDDGRPYLIDFQISWHWPAERGGRTRPTRWILQVLQRSDAYHLLKHWRRFRPDQMSEEQLTASRRPPIWIAWHRLLFRPFTLLRRRILEHLGARPRPQAKPEALAPAERRHESE
jgi:serine/threonine protein kinase